MKKINFKNILKKTFKKKTKKKKQTKVAAKKSKITKIKKVKKKILKGNFKKIKKEEISKNDTHRINKLNEQKPEIKKIKKQETEKKIYKLKEYVVYPKHGVGQITELKKINIGGIEVETYLLKFAKDKAIGMVPVNKQSHLRPLATINQVNKCISILKGKPKIKRSMWSRRAQEYEAKISSGKIYELAEVVRDLNKGDDLMIDQSYSERQLFEKAYERLLSEFNIVLGTSLEDTQKKLDKALKRNLEAQKAKIEKQLETQTNQIESEDIEASSIENESVE
jgi:CarD family transcriptional regulator